jgi:type IV pilus assembly protein PilM
MAFGMFSAQCSPIAIDFGSSSVKLLQIGMEGERPQLLAAAELPLSPTIASNTAELHEHLGVELPKLLRLGRFKGKRAVCSVPCGQTMIQHMQIAPSDGPASRDALVKAQLQAQFGWSPANVVVRAVDVTEVHRDSQPRVETICFAMSREAVMQHVQMLGKLKLEIVGVHTEVMSMMRAFEHLHRREGDEQTTTLYIDIGYGGTKVAIGHGTKLAFAKCIQIGGRHFDQRVAETLHCDLASAKAHRLSQESPLSQAVPASAGATGAGRAAATAVSERRGGAKPAELAAALPPGTVRPPARVDFTDLLEAVADELSSCLRYHHAMFPDRSINRAVFLGGEARQSGLCRHIAQTLHAPAQLGDPLARLMVAGTPASPGLTLGQPQPGWAVPYGLCTAPTDL